MYQSASESRGCILRLSLMLILLLAGAWLMLGGDEVVLRLAGIPTGNGRIFLAMVDGDHEALRLALRNGADANAVNSDGTSALGWAVMNGDSRSVQLLLAYGAKPNNLSNLQTPLLIGACD